MTPLASVPVLLKEGVVSRRKKLQMEYWPPSLVRRAATILGPSSATADALADYEKRRAAGQDVHIFREGQAWVVGPCPTDTLKALGVKVEDA